MDPERRVEVEWELAEDEVRPVRIQVLSSDRAGILADLAGVMKKQEINILEAEVRTTEDMKGIATFTIQVHNAKQLNQVLKEIGRLKETLSVRRLDH
jgi:GTP pyrophosphokinase